MNNNSLILCKQFLEGSLKPLELTAKVSSLYCNVDLVTQDLEELYNITEYYSPLPNAGEPYLNEVQFKDKIKSHIDKWSNLSKES